MIQRAHQPILIVEDSPEDFEATMRAFKKSGFANPVFRCEDGDEALDYMFRRGAYSDPASSPRPGLILLDLNLPGTDGREFLTEIKQTPSLKKIPVIVLTTSSEQSDIETCYDAGANSYICKPVNITALVDTLQRMREFWFEIVVFPEGDSDA